MEILKCLLTKNRCYKTGAKIIPKGIMVHSTGANNPTLKRYVQPLDHDVQNAYDPDRQMLLDLFGTNKNQNDWNRDNLDVCVHAFIGKLSDGSVATVQTLPWNYKGWHCGIGTSGKSANDTHVSFEICEDDLFDYDYFLKTKNEAVNLVAMLCAEYSLDPMSDGVIICHQDGHKRGIASNHGDIYNWWPNFGYNMDNFRKEVYDKMHKEDDDMTYYEKREDIPDYYASTIDKLLDSGALKGKGDGILNVSEDFCRVFTVLDRLGKL